MYVRRYDTAELRAICRPKYICTLVNPYPQRVIVSRTSSGIRADPVHGVPPPSGVEGFPEHAAFDVPGTITAASLAVWVCCVTRCLRYRIDHTEYAK